MVLERLLLIQRSFKKPKELKKKKKKFQKFPKNKIKVNWINKRFKKMMGFMVIIKTMFKLLDKININNKKTNFKNKEICNQVFIKQNPMF